MSYEKFAEIYGRDVVEAPAVPIVLATKEQCERLQQLCEGLKVEQETIDKWLTKADVESIKEMSNEQISSLIKHCENQVLKLSLTGAK